MSIFDYILDIGLVAIVLLQVRTHPLTNRGLMRPVLILAIAFANYFRSVPTAGNDLLLAGVLLALGASLGIACGLATKVWTGEDGTVMSRSAGLAVTFWVLGMGSRFIFTFWITHGGIGSIARFSEAHSITSGDAWTVALLAMAAAQVLCRVSVLALRRRSLRRRTLALALAPQVAGAPDFV